MIDIEAIRQSTRLVKRLPDDLVSQAQRNVIALLEEIDRLQKDVERLRVEIEVLRLYGNKDCTAMADAELRRRAEPQSGPT